MISHTEMLELTPSFVFERLLDQLSRFAFCEMFGDFMAGVIPLLIFYGLVTRFAAIIRRSPSLFGKEHEEKK